MALPRPEKGFYKTLLALAVPLLFQNLVSFAVGFADNLMVGSLGEAAISGVYLGNQPQNLLQTVILGVDSAMLILCAQYWGRKDTDSIKGLIAIGTRIGFALGLVFFILVLFAPDFVLRIFTKDADTILLGKSYLKYVCWSYLLFVGTQLMIAGLKSVEVVKVGMYASFLSLTCNIILNWLLIFGKLGFPQMGVAGAALATLISRIVEFGVVFIYLFFVDKKLQLKFSDMLGFNKTLFKDYVKYGLPVIAGQVVFGVYNNIQSSIYGSLGNSATTAVSIVGMVWQMAAVIMMSVNSSVGIMTGKLVGEGDVEKVKNHARVCQIMFLVSGFVFCGIILLIRNPFISLYNITEETRAMAHQFLTCFAFIYIGTCYQGFGLGSLVKAGGDTKFVFINDTIFEWCINIPLALIVKNVFHAPAWVIYLCLKSDELTKCIVAYFKINSFNWIKNLTRTDDDISPDKQISNEISEE